MLTYRKQQEAERIDNSPMDFSSNSLIIQYEIQMMHKRERLMKILP